MKDFQQRKKIRKTLYSRNIVIAVAIVTVLLVRGAVEVTQKMHESNVNAKQVEKELTLARIKHEELLRNMAMIETHAGVEREIRQKFSVTKSGEEVAVIVDPQPRSSSTEKKKQSFWSSLGNWFSDIF
jgi:hypothetical protein